MLILTRRPGETLYIDDDVTVTILGVQGNQVRIDIDAPREVEVHREEIYWRVHPERRPGGMDDFPVEVPAEPPSSQEKEDVRVHVKRRRV